MPNNEIKHGRSKHISSYGGVASIIETTGSSIIIETFDNWGYNDLNEKLAHFIIKDDRLLQRLKTRFPNLKHLVSIPTDRDSSLYEVSPKASYFPKWFYCSYCHRFTTYAEWKKRWRDAGKNLDFFNPPKCSNKTCLENHLEQIRFVMTCNNGHIHDLPWEFWNNRLSTDKTNEDESEDDNNKFGRPIGPQLSSEKCCGEQQNLVYKISRENTELSGIWIECKNCSKKANLKGIFNYEQNCKGKKYWLGQSNGKFHKEECTATTIVKLKTSNSVYYVNNLSSLYLPELQINISPEHRIDIDALVEDGSTKEEIIKTIHSLRKVPKELIKQYLETGEIKYIPDNIYRQAEYEYFLEKEEPENKQIRFRVIDCKEVIKGFSKLVKVDKLKKTTVQTSFTRNEPIDVDSILQDTNEYEYSVQRQSVSKNNFETKTLPALESYGEGILFVLDRNIVEYWEKQKEVITRTEKIKLNAENADWKSHKIIAETLIPRKILIHTLSHLIMRELEYVCGYPASCLSERLYVNDEMCGFLISAYDGSDGYLGGLSNLCNDLINLNSIIRSAIYRAADCSSDPICLESEGQGVGQLNLAACHSCVLTPETTCELSNLYLDRKLVVDEYYGYLKINHY